MPGSEDSLHKSTLSVLFPGISALHMVSDGIFIAIIKISCCVMRLYIVYP